MIVKLSDFILEQTVSNADVIDISMEQAKAEIDVTTALCDVYVKRGYSQVFTEAESGGFVDTIHKFFVSIGNWFRKMWIKFLGYFSKKRLDKIISKLNSISDSEKKTFKGYLPFDGNRLKAFVSTFIDISDKFSNKINSLITNNKSFNAYDLRDDLQRSRSSVKSMIKSNNDSYEYGYDDYYKFMTDLKSQYNENQQKLERIRNTFKQENYKRITDAIDGLSEKDAKKIYKDINRLYTSYSSIATDSITCMMKLVQNAEKNKGSAKQGRLTDDVTRETPSNPTPPDNPTPPSNSNNSNNTSNSNNPTPPDNPNNPSNPTPQDNPTNNDQKTDTKKKKETLTKSELDKYFEDSINSFKSIISKAKTIKDDTKEYIKSIDSFVKEDKDVVDSIERLDDIGTNLIPNLLKELDNIHKNVYMPILTEAIKQHSLDDNDYLEAEIQAGKRAQDIMNQIRNSLDSIEGLHKSIDSKIGSLKPDKNDDSDIGKIDNALFEFIKESRLYFDHLHNIGMLSDKEWKHFKTCTIGKAKDINKSDAKKIASWCTSETYRMNGISDVGRIYDAIVSYPEELKLGGDVNWCKPSELNASKTKAMLFEINEAIRLMKETISKKKKANFEPDKETVDSVKAIKLAKQRVFTSMQNFISDFAKEYRLGTDDAFRFNLDTNDYDSSQLTEIANKLDKFCKSKPDNISEKHIKDLSEIADMINSVSKLVSDPNNYGPNFIADMAKYSKRATALSREFDSGKKQKESNDTQSNESKKKESNTAPSSETKKKETKDEQQIPEDRLRRLEEGLDGTIKVIRPLDDRKYWVIFPELYDEYKTIYDAIIKYYEDMRGKLNTNEKVDKKGEYAQLVNLENIIKKSDKISGLKRKSSAFPHFDSPEYNIIAALQVATTELDIYEYIPRRMFVTNSFTLTGDIEDYNVATCTDADFDICIKFRENRNELIAKYTESAEKLLKEQNDSADESKKSE